MASEKKPIKGILKTSSSFDRDGQAEKTHMKWDEMNILATYHPADKDYGHKKIDEPPTPYSKYEDSEEEGGTGAQTEDGIHPENIAERLQESSSTPKVLQTPEPCELSDEDPDETEEERAKRKLFEQKRKLHYNEFYAVKLAKQLMAQDDEEAEEAEETAENSMDTANTPANRVTDSK